MEQKEIVPFEQAVGLKRLGFNGSCNYLYNSTDDVPKPFLCDVGLSQDWNSLYIHETNRHLMSAPTFSQVFNWFRINYQLPSWVYTSDNKKFYYSILKNKRFMMSDFYVITKTKNPVRPYNTYEEAELACLMKLIKIIENK